MSWYAPRLAVQVTLVRRVTLEGETGYQGHAVMLEPECSFCSTDYYTEDSYGGFLGAPAIPISDAYNLTDGAFCVSSVLSTLR